MQLDVQQQQEEEKQEEEEEEKQEEENVQQEEQEVENRPIIDTGLPSAPSPPDTGSSLLFPQYSFSSIERYLMHKNVSFAKQSIFVMCDILEVYHYVSATHFTDTYTCEPRFCYSNPDVTTRPPARCCRGKKIIPSSIVQMCVDCWRRGEGWKY